ncbi:MAG: adenylyltransferase/cytidyltransferase family protein [Mailhella sp.]|nr:adenylyltransferase/cytidyltransferase family protein [Mailhella sp.]
MLTHPKIVTAEELQRRLAEKRPERLVFTNGCYDILHPGHVDLLARAAALGDMLVLGLNSDDSVRRQNKGPGRPFNAFEARAFVLAHLESVDHVVRFDEDTPERLIRVLRPDVLVKGGDWDVSRIAGADFVRSYGGEVFSLPLLEGWSTTRLAGKIMALGREDAQR